MDKTGTVVKIIDDLAYVSVKRTSACGENCANCSGTCTAGKVEALVYNTAKAKVGDTVKIQAESGKVILSSVILFFGPLFLSVIFGCIAHTVFERTYVTAIVSILSFLGTLVLIKKFERKIMPRSEIVEIIKSLDGENN